MVQPHGDWCDWVARSPGEERVVNMLAVRMYVAVGLLVVALFIVASSLNGNNGSYTNTDDVQKDMARPAANRRKQPHRRDPSIGKHNSGKKKRVEPVPVQDTPEKIEHHLVPIPTAPPLEPEGRKEQVRELYSTRVARDYFKYIGEDGRFLSREYYRDWGLAKLQAAVRLRRFFRRAALVEKLMARAKYFNTPLLIEPRLFLPSLYATYVNKVRRRRSAWLATRKKLRKRFNESQWATRIAIWWRSTNWKCRYYDYQEKSVQLSYKAWLVHLRQAVLHRKATKWKFFSEWFISAMSKHIVLTPSSIHFDGLVQPSTKHLRALNKYNALECRLRGYNGLVVPLALLSSELDLNVPPVRSATGTYPPPDYHQMYYVYVRSKAKFIQRKCVNWFRRTHRRMELPVKEDWRFSWHRLFAAVFLSIFVVLCLVFKRKQLAIALGVEGLVVYLSLGAILLWVFMYNKYTGAYNFRIMFFDSNIKYTSYVNQSALDWTYRRLDNFEGSGYNQIETVFVYKPYFTRMMNGLSSHRSSTKTKQNAKDLILSDLSDWLQRPIDSGPGQSLELYLRTLHEYWLTRASSACSRYKELEDAYESHRISDKTRNGVDDLVFRQKDSSGASGLAVSHVAGVLNRKN